MRKGAMTKISKLTKTSGPKCLCKKYSENDMALENKDTDFRRPTSLKLKRSETASPWDLLCIIGSSQCTITCKGVITKVSKLTITSGPKFLWENYSDNDIVLEDKDTDFCRPTSLNLMQSQTAPWRDSHCVIGSSQWPAMNWTRKQEGRMVGELDSTMSAYCAVCPATLCNQIQSSHIHWLSYDLC